MRTADISYTSTIGNAMSNTVINGGNLGDVLRSGRDTATDTDTLKNTLTSGLSAGITAGLTEKFNLTNANTFTDKLKESALSNITSTAVQSAINGDSFTESLKHQAINTIVMAGADYAANQIGQQYHTNGFSDNNAINKATQLTLHAGLGAITNTLTGNDALSGAIAGVSGEVFAELLGNQLYGTTSGSELNPYQQTVLKEYGGLAAGISSLITGKLQNLDNEDISNNVYAGYRVGKNAVENNLLYNQLLGDSKTTSDYNKEGRKHPTLGMIRPHKGVDTIPLTDNTKIHAAADGISEGSYTQMDKNGNVIGWGNYTVIRHEDEDGNVYLTRYAHMKEKPDIKPGTPIKEGQPIGIQGNTGISAGAHLHYEIQKYNPETGKWDYLNPQLPENMMGNYKYLKDTPYQQNLRKK